MILSLIQLIIDGIAALIDVVVSVLPGSPLSSTSFQIADSYLSYINYFLPIGEIVDLVGVWLVCITGYYIYMALGRWAKLID